MSRPPVYNSKDTRYKSPYGAVPSGTAVSFTLRPPRSAGFSGGVLTARFESWENETRHVPLRWTDSDLGEDVFSCALEVGDYVGLIWYTFALHGLDGREELFPEYQLTVYADGTAAPRWFGEGVSYQIFPDRFRRSKIPNPDGMVGGRWVHQGWEEEPEYRPDHRGEIRNRDFFGGDLPGVIEKLDYLQQLGVETLYFCPVFEGAENHRYGTADYHAIDPMLGTEADFRRLCDEAHSRGMRVLLDGVFNHTGFVSRYFNGDGFYPEPGACQSKESPYYPWFRFTHWPDRYESWWGIYSLPGVEENDPSYRDFIYGGPDSVVRRWLRAGADGWRLDVADELPDDFIAGIRAAALAEKPESVVIGEVWEDGSTKIAYGVRRKHILGRHCDGLMNYPLRAAILGYLFHGDGGGFLTQMEAIRENYPRSAFYSSMNFLGTHDTVRILTLLGTGDEHKGQSRQWRAEHRLSPHERHLGTERLKLAALLLYAFPGSPMIYYGDEAGMEGFEDPFNRRTFPWGHEDTQLTSWFSALGALRKKHPALRRGELRYLAGEGPLLAFLREGEGERLLAAFNAGEHPVFLPLPGQEGKPPIALIGAGHWQPGDGEETECGLTLPPRSGGIFQL